jgi:hypothetical protein
VSRTVQPPSVVMLTPSGRFDVNKKICLSMSDFHPETWNPMWSVSTILVGLLSFMVRKTGFCLSPLMLTPLVRSWNPRKQLEAWNPPITSSECTLPRAWRCVCPLVDHDTPLPDGALFVPQYNCRDETFRKLFPDLVVLHEKSIQAGAGGPTATGLSPASPVPAPKPSTDTPLLSLKTLLIALVIVYVVYKQLMRGPDGL